MQRFFECLRLASACNDHPATPTALQVCKLLCLFSTLVPRPSKFGNCRVVSQDKVAVLISLKDKKEIYEKPKVDECLSRSEFFKKQLDNVVKNDDWDVFAFLSAEHDYCAAEEDECIMYFISGRVCRRLLETMPVKECGVCKKALITSVVPKEGLVLEESTKERFLCHPNAIFNQLIQKLNSIFDANKDRLDISGFLVKEAARQKIFRFPCDQHKIEVMAFVVEYFLSIKMTKLCRDINDRLKQNMHKKKIAKHYTT